MIEGRKIFHESWYRIAGQQLSLRASVRVRRQLFRGERWYVLHDPFTGQFFRLRPPAYDFVARLTLGSTVEQAWKETMARDPEGAPGQEEVIQLLAQLYHANLLHYELPAASEQLFERYRKRKQRVRRATLTSIMFIRIPLFDPDGLLKRLMPFARALIGPLGVALWLAVVGAGVKVAIDHFPELRLQSQGILSLANLPLLYLSLILVKTLHEFGHALTVRRFGGEVHTMGIMFLIFNPLPYMDATAAWAFRSKWRRVLVGASGMLFELFVAATAAFLWANTGPGVLHALAYNTMFIASVSTLLFNINPLLRFDGYYILSDLLDIPNLHNQASQHLRHLVERYAFGYKKSRSPASSRKEAFWLTFFGITSGAYKLVVFTTILLFVADRFLLLGIIMAAVCAVAWVLAPALRLVHYLATSPRLERTRLRAAVVCLLAIVGAAGILYFLPFPNSFKAPGILEAEEHAVVFTATEGTVQEILTSPDSRVRRGQELLRLANPELDFRIAETAASLQEALAMRQKALLASQGDLRAIDSLTRTIRARIQRLEEQRARLLIRAEIDGLWVAPRLEETVGMWLGRGVPMGELVDDRAFHFTSVVSQSNVSQVFTGGIRSSQVRLAGQAGRGLRVTEVTRIPMERRELPSLALGFRGGGEVAVDVSEASGAVAAEPFYEVRLGVVPDPEVKLLHRRSGRVRFRLAPEPLLLQAYRKLRQLLQRRYQL